MNLIYFISIALISIVSADIESDSVSRASNEFALKLLLETSTSTPGNANLVIGPYTIWTAMSILNEGAKGNTAYQLETALGIPPRSKQRKDFRKLQVAIAQNLTRKEEGVILEVFNSIFTKSDAALREKYQQLVRKIYNSEIKALDFNDVYGTTQYINEKLSEATRGRLPDAVTEDIVRDAEMIITSALYFKGRWEMEFSKSATKDKPFHDEEGHVISTVPIMQRTDEFAYSKILGNQASAVELPYLGNTMSMIIILPDRTTSLSSLLEQMARTQFTTIVDAFRTPNNRYPIDVNLGLPKFKIASDLDVIPLLQNMGIRDIFTVKANLTGITSGDSLYVSHVKHQAEVEVDEGGTEGSAATIVGALPVSYREIIGFYVDRPFAFFVIDKRTNTIILMGKINNPRPN